MKKNRPGEETTTVTFGELESRRMRVAGPAKYKELIFTLTVGKVKKKPDILHGIPSLRNWSASTCESGS